PENLHGLCSISCRMHLVPSSLQRRAEQPPKLRCVLHDQDRLAPTLLCRGRWCDLGFLNGGLNQRQIDTEGRALSNSALYRNVTPTLVDDAVDGRKTQSGSLPKLLSGEERLKNVSARLSIHPAASVAHGQQHIAAWPQTQVLTRVLFIQVGIGGLNDHLATLWHGIARIRDQIDQDLLDL